MKLLILFSPSSSVFIIDLFLDVLPKLLNSLNRIVRQSANNEFKRMWNEATAAFFKLLSQYLRGGCEGRNEKKNLSLEN
jgi:hypothetical protein